MKKRIKYYHCPYCNNRDKNLYNLYSHMRRYHKEDVKLDEKKRSIQQIEFDYRNKIVHPKICVICKTNKPSWGPLPVKWNKENNRYDRYCTIKCKDLSAKIAKENMKKKYGKDHLMNDPEHQAKMMKGSKHSGEYTFSKDKEKVWYYYSFEKDFLIHCDKELNMKGKEIVSAIERPVPIDYLFQGKKHLYIPDFFIPSLNLLIEIKNGDENPNTHPEQAVNKDKLKMKIKYIIKNYDYNFIIIYDKKYDKFDDILEDLKFSDSRIIIKEIL